MLIERNQYGQYFFSSAWKALMDDVAREVRSVGHPYERSMSRGSGIRRRLDPFGARVVKGDTEEWYLEFPDEASMVHFKMVWG